MKPGLSHGNCSLQETAARCAHLRDAILPPLNKLAMEKNPRGRKKSSCACRKTRGPGDATGDDA